MGVSIYRYYMPNCGNCFFRYGDYCPIIDDRLPDLLEKCDAWRVDAPTDWRCEKD